MILSFLALSLMIIALLYGRVSIGVTAAVLAAVAALLLIRRGVHSHTGSAYLRVDELARSSRLTGWNTGYKVLISLTLLVICVTSRSWAVPVVVGVSVSLISIVTGHIGLRGYLSMLMVPVTFVALSAVAVLYDVSPHPQGLLDIPLFSVYLSVTPASQQVAGVLIARAMGALCCLYALSLSTPLYDTVSFLRRRHVPAVIIELMVLIYRYIFILLDCTHQMSEAAASRLGYRNYRSTWRSFTGIASNLFARSFRQAGASFDAMESRCYQGELCFLENEKPLQTAHVLAGMVPLALPVAMIVWERVAS